VVIRAARIGVGGDRTPPIAVAPTTIDVVPHRDQGQTIIHQDGEHGGFGICRLKNRPRPSTCVLFDEGADRSFSQVSSDAFQQIDNAERQAMIPVHPLGRISVPASHPPG
jgi:hypothetical protein